MPPPVNPVIGQPQLPSPLLPKDLDGTTWSSYDDILCSAVDPDADAASRNPMRFYDYGIRQWLQGITVMHGRMLLTFRSSPMRAFSTVKQLLEQRNVVGKEYSITAEDGQTEPDKIPLPFACFESGDVKPNSAMQKPATMIRNLKFLDANKRRTAYTRYPKAVLIPYQIDIYVRMRNQANFLQSRILEQFDGPIAYWYVSTPFRKERALLMPIRWVSFTDNSDLEQDKDRIIRKTLSVEVEALEWNDIMIAPTFETVTTEIDVVDDRDLSNPVKIDSATSVKQTDLAGPTTAEVAALPVSPGDGGASGGYY